MEFFKAHIKAIDKAKARNVLSKMQAQEIEEMHLPAVPKAAVEAFVTGQRKNIWTIVIDDEDCFILFSDKRTAEAILEMMKLYGKEELPLAPLVPGNIKDFLDGKRKDIATMEIANMEPGEELPGHVS
jgi:hypothetical protein